MYECNMSTGEQNVDRPVDTWTQDSTDGRIMFIVFYTQACRWRRCIGCNFHDNASKVHVGYENIINQINYVLDSILPEDNINKVILSNGGSMLDEDTFSTTALIYLVYRLNKDYKNIRIISLETRLEYVDLAELTILKRALKEGNSETELELGIGFEAFDDHIRNDLFDKGLSKIDFMTFLDMIKDFQYSVKTYFMLKPVPDITDEVAIEDIKQAIYFLNDMSKSFGVKINMHLNPTYVAKRSGLVKPFIEGRFTPPTLYDVAKSIISAKDLDNDNFTIYIGLSDEGLAVDGGSFLGPGDDTIVEMLEEFNRTQDYSIIEKVIGFDNIEKDCKRFEQQNYI